MEVENTKIESIENLPWIVFKLNNGLYAISSDYSDGILMLPSNITAVPDSPRYYRGLVVVRDEAIPIIDLRTFFGLHSSLDDVLELDASLEQRKYDHHHWVDVFVECCSQRKPFDLPKNPHECQFGMWYYNFDTKVSSIKQILKKIEEPHRLLHEVAYRYENYLSEYQATGVINKELENTFIDDAKNKYMPVTIALLDDLRKAFIDSLHQMTILLKNRQEEKVGIIVDEVVAVEPIIRINEGDEILNSTLYTDGVAKSSSREGNILIVNWENILSAL